MVSFHVTCAIAVGARFEAHDWPNPMHVICHKHTGSQLQQTRRHLTDLQTGDRVIARHRYSGRYYEAKIVGDEQQEFYSVNFDDGSVSDDVFPEDITVCTGQN